MLEKTEEGRKRQEEIEYIKDRVLRRFPLLGVTLSHLHIVATDHLRTADGKLMGTATTDGETIYYHPDFFASLSDEEKIFIVTHEIMHVAFNHILRSEKKDQKWWGVATDSVINQILKGEGLLLVKGSIDRGDAINRSAEEMYEILLEEEEEEEEYRELQVNNSRDEEEDKESEYGSHEIWKEAVEQAKEQAVAENQKQQKHQDDNGEEQEKSDFSGDGDESEQANSGDHEIKQRRRQEQKEHSSAEKERREIGGEGKGAYQSEQREDEEGRERSNSDFERSFAAKNRKEREIRAHEFKKSLHTQKSKVMATLVQEAGISFGNLGTSETTLDWKKILKKSLEDQEYRWSYRRANADNDFMARVEELEDEELAETEVMLDVSGSVDVELLKEFLRQLKPILKTSKLKVGCFDEYFYGLKEIRTNVDIDNFKIISRSKWTENWNLAVKSFSKRKDINKIVFTDGYPAPGTMPDESTKNINVIWLVYGNKNFNPICGNVIQVDLA